MPLPTTKKRKRKLTWLGFVRTFYSYPVHLKGHAVFSINIFYSLARLFHLPPQNKHLYIWKKKKASFDILDIECNRCKLKPDKEGPFKGHDPCIQGLPGLTAACCGHGDTDIPYIQNYAYIFIREPNGLSRHYHRDVTPEQIREDAKKLVAQNLQIK
jgi:hypothetical protein